MALRKNYRLRFGLVLLVSLTTTLVVIAAPSPETINNSNVDGARQLSATEAAERIAALRIEIAYHDELYFKKSAPVISDSAYDQLKRELMALEQAFPKVARENGNAQVEVADDRVGSFPNYRHRVPMLSLNKSYTEAELRAFDSRLGKQLQQRELEYVVEPKFDGLAISVTFEKGKLVRAVTRGDGVEGDDVTTNILSIRPLPQNLRTLASSGQANPIPDLIELRGEVYLTFAEFERINRERESANEPVFSNPRNLAAGTLKQLDAAVLEKRKLEIVFYGIGACEPAQLRPNSQVDLLWQLDEWGLPTIKTPKAVRGIDAVWKSVQALGKERSRLAFPVDGAVVKLNAVDFQDRVGVNAQGPLWAIAYKFSTERAETQIRSITLQVGRTGVLTPVAELVPVKLGGSTVARASLFNRDEITRRDIRVGDFVYVEKAGEIIPSIVGVNRSRRTADSSAYSFPSDCPSCHVSLVQESGEAAIRCPNLYCSAQVKRRIEYFASKSCVNISGLGPVMIDKLVERKLVNDVADLYELRREDLISMGKNVEKSADRLLTEINRSKQAELWRFINGLGIPQVGEVTARSLARHFDSLGKLARARSNDFFRDGKPLISGVNESVAKSILGYLSQETNQAILTDLESHLVAQ